MSYFLCIALFCCVGGGWRWLGFMDWIHTKKAESRVKPLLEVRIRKQGGVGIVHYCGCKARSVGGERAGLTSLSAS